MKVRDALELAAEIIMVREKLGKRPAKAYVHNDLGWDELVALVRQNRTSLDGPSRVRP